MLVTDADFENALIDLQGHAATATGRLTFICRYNLKCAHAYSRKYRNDARRQQQRRHPSLSSSWTLGSHSPVSDKAGLPRPALFPNVYCAR